MAIQNIEDLFALRKPVKRKASRGTSSPFDTQGPGRACVYVVCGSDQPVKVGKAQDPYRRLFAMQCGSPQELYLCFWAEFMEPDAFRVEALAHGILRPHTASGEWFDVSSDFAAAAVLTAAQQLGFTPFRLSGAPYGVEDESRDPTEHEKAQMQSRRSTRPKRVKS